ncbi:MAG: hypothetical protein ABUL71_05480 [Gemmatimonadota bacterium]
MKVAAIVLAVSVGFVTPGSAQATLPKDAAWTLEGGEGGYCISYLVDPVLARALVPSSTSLIPAGTGADQPELANYIKDEPRFAQWIPAMICLGFYQRVKAGDRILAQAKPNRPIIVATSSIAAQGAHGVAGANAYLLDFMTNDRGVANAADAIGVDMSTIELTQKTKLEGEDATVTLSFSGVQVFWSGHAIADSSVGKTRSVSFGYGGPKSANWLINMETTFRSTRAMPAVLWVGGKNSLAKALLASPGRPIGPYEGGGGATIAFHAVTRK